VFSVRNKIEDYIVRRLSNYNLKVSYENKDIEIHASEESLYNVLSFLHHDTHCQFEQLLDLIVLDCPDHEKRFDLIYVIRSLKNNQRLRVLIRVNTETASVSEIYKNAAWLEREAWEMFGIFFKNSRDLRRLLTNFRVAGYPLRKDYPVSGMMDYVFDEHTDKFLSVPLLLIQEHRVFDVSSPWEGASPHLEEKQAPHAESQTQEAPKTIPEEEWVE